MLEKSREIYLQLKTQVALALQTKRLTTRQARIKSKRSMNHTVMPQYNNLARYSRLESPIEKNRTSNASSKVKKSWERIHLDLIGPIKPQSLSHHKYILLVTDNASGYLAGFPLVHNNYTAEILINLLENENRILGYFPNKICSDGGGEFVGTRLVQFLKRNHIKQLISETYHPKHNGRAERANRTIVDSMRATFKALNLKKNMWHTNSLTII
ncbi:hypothetical protein VP01_832g1 [Puccinia sorghi]|uniref:Integrase catalytic domain-containing protein n=1 Tax=Puccinia sorghi TaxID=27349 RepID=A0A0L6UAG5_9BASI|nr:hypothetical protein VP01_832g1 [Puccinia sorghi]